MMKLLHILGALCTIFELFLFPKWMAEKNAFELTGKPIDTTVGIAFLVFGFLALAWIVGTLIALLEPKQNQASEELQ